MKSILIIAAIVLLPLSSFAQEAYSVNGFTCGKKENTVSCRGQFPGVKGTFGAIGTYSVIVQYERDGRDYQYDSHQGCLLVGDQKKRELRMTNRKGKSATFTSIKKAMDFCKVAK